MIYLASNSPRRKELLGGLGVPFEVRVTKGIDESYPPTLPASEVAEYISRKKAAAYTDFVRDSDDKDICVITADTVVICDNDILGKPKDAEDAHRMLRKLSGRSHQVVTGVTMMVQGSSQSSGAGGARLTSSSSSTFKVLRKAQAQAEQGVKQHSFSVTTHVTFKDLTDEEITYYIDNYKPFDKAGAYGIQEWIGYIGVTRLEGSYFNVMGFPVQRVYEALNCKITLPLRIKQNK